MAYILSVWDDIPINHFNKRPINVNFIAILVFVTIVVPRSLPSLCLSHIAHGGLNSWRSHLVLRITRKATRSSDVRVRFSKTTQNRSLPPVQCYALRYKKRSGNCRPWSSKNNNTVPAKENITQKRKRCSSGHIWQILIHHDSLQLKIFLLLLIERTSTRHARETHDVYCRNIL
jgi:hypothetical protein